MLKQNLGQKQLQKLSPQQIQLMKLLQIPTATLDQRIKEELESNPALDEGADEEHNEVIDLNTEKRKEDQKEETKEEVKEEASEENFELDDYIKEYLEDDPISYKVRESFTSTEDDKTIPIAVEQSFHDFLEEQVGMMDLKADRKVLIANQIVGSIDEDGYLRREPSAIIDDLMFTQNIEATVGEVESMLLKIQNFEPAGVGARNLRESLFLQLKNKLDKGTENNVRAKQVALRIIDNHFEEFSKKHYDRLKKNLFISESELKEAIDEILKLNPKPASGRESHSRATSQYIVPDFIIINRDGELDLTLNSRNAPDLRINDQYMEMLKTYQAHTKSSKQQKQAVMFVKQKIDSAKWFIDAILQRQQTLHSTMYSIMQYQEEYFLTGDDRRIRPMILKDIAEITGLDISTISRVANSKFVQTEFGTKKLKSFFSESMMTQDGKEVSTLEVKNILSDIVSGEDKRKPLSDEKLKDMLLRRGYNIARRTVAKYREQLGIPVARLRKEL